MLYKNEFGHGFDLGFNLNDYPYLKDKSWHNDVSPSFYFNVGSQFYVLWVDYYDPAQREDTNTRYLIQEAVNEGDNVNPEVYSPDGKVIFEHECFKEVKHFITNLILQHGNILS